jgi:ubiquinone/menaquinone biosynthesis C-methylase UbiE
MKTFRYGHDADALLSESDLFVLFNNYRVYKYLIGILVALGKIDFPSYKILEPGCGSGSKLRFLTECRAKPENCYGLEMSTFAVELCKSLSPAVMNFQQGSALAMPYDDDEFDIVICSGLFGCFNVDQDVERLSAEIDRVLKRDGILVVIDINENFNNFYANTPAVMAKTLRTFDSKNGELEGLLEDKFTVVSRLPAFVIDNYLKEDLSPSDVTDLPIIDKGIDDGSIDCAYTLWVFFKKTDDDAS